MKIFLKTNELEKKLLKFWETDFDLIFWMNNCDIQTHPSNTSDKKANCHS